MPELDPAIDFPEVQLDDDYRVTDHVSGTLSELDREVITHVPPGGNWASLPADFPSRRVQQIRESAARGEGSRSTYYGRLLWDEPSYTISTYITRPGNGCFIHPTEPRLLTVREAARLQSFPDFWRFSGTIRQRAVQIGNAVPPLMARSLMTMFPAGTVVDLFSGTGGLSLGAHMAGHSVVAAIDNEPSAVVSHNLNLPGSSGFVADLSKPDGMRPAFSEALRRADGAVDVLVGGPPCQGFSTAGKALADDDRNRLLLSFVEGVRILKPRALLMENVIALAQTRGREYLNTVRSELGKLGYMTDVKVIHAEGYGVPQRRRRTILVGSRDSDPRWPSASHMIASPSFLKQQPGSPGATHWVSVRDAIADLQVQEAKHLDGYSKPSAPQSDYQKWARLPLEML